MANRKPGFGTAMPVSVSGDNASVASKGYKTSRIVLPVSALCFFFLFLIWASYIRQRTYDRKDAIQFAIERNSNLAVALEQYAIRTLRNADAVLQIVKMDYNQAGKSLDLQQLLQKNVLNGDFIKGVAIIDADGRLKMTNLAYTSDSIPSFSQRDYFKFHAENNTDSLLISGPLVSKLIGRQAIIISRRLDSADGKFAGVVALQIEPSTFTSFYAQAKLLPNDIMSLIAPNGTTYARRTGATESSGENISKSPLFAHVAHNSDSFYFAKDAIHHVPTWFSYRKLAEYPMIATVGSSEQDILADYRNKQPRYITPRIIISLLVILFSALSVVILIHRRKLAARMASEEQRYQRLLTEQVIAAQEREREWIGRELHDNVNQVLTTVKLYLEMVNREQHHPLIPRSMELINSSINEIRNLSHQLSAPTLGTGSLIDSINTLLENLSLTTGIQFRFDHSGYHQRLIMSQKLALYRILQEQLNNVIKHAGATSVWIKLSQNNDELHLTVRDNGKGFDLNTKTSGMGLHNMMSRAKVLGGTLHIETASGKGCLLQVIFPIAKTQGANSIQPVSLSEFGV